MAVFIATALLGVDLGLIVGVAFSLFLIIYRIVLYVTIVAINNNIMYNIPLSPYQKILKYM